MGRQRRHDQPMAAAERRLFAVRLSPRACRWALPIAVILPAGCSGMNQLVGNDPLLGGPPLRAPAAVAPSPPAPVAVLPIPAANSTLSTAALAAAAPRSPDGTQDLRIGSPQANTGSDGWSRDRSNQPADVRRAA